MIVNDCIKVVMKLHFHVLNPLSYTITGGGLAMKK